MAQIDIPIGNSLLRRLSAADLDLLRPLERVQLTLRQTLEVANTPSQFVYFLEDGFASVVAEATSTGATEIGVIGREGMTGIGIAYDDLQSPFETFVQIAGTALRCETARLQHAFAASEAVRSLLVAYARAFAIQVAATAVANGRSTLEERLALWLLMASDRVGASFHITHEFVSIMLAVRRSGVTIATQSLEGRGLIRANRGEIKILNRQGLIDAANGGYGLAEREYERLMGS